jgi:hypothetical protein
VSLLFRCGAHLSNLALGSSGASQRSNGISLVQVATRFRVKWSASHLTGRVRSVLAAAPSTTRSTGRADRVDQRHKAKVLQSDATKELIGRVYRASGPFPEKDFVDRTRPVITDQTLERVRSLSNSDSKSTIATDRSRPVTSTGASGQYGKC